MSTVQVTDIMVQNHGSIVLVYPVSSEAREWIEQNVSDESQWFGGGLVVEPRYVENLIQGMLNDGLVVE